jgi:hypothetical protein
MENRQHLVAEKAKRRYVEQRSINYSSEQPRGDEQTTTIYFANENSDPVLFGDRLGIRGNN